MGSGPSILQAEEVKDTKVLIVGGGYGGCSCAMALKKAGVPFVIVEPKEFFYHNIAALRAAVFPEFTKVTTIPLKEAFGDDFKQASVSSIDLAAKKAHLDNSEEVKYSHLVLATGTTGSYPATTDLKSLPELRNFNDDVATSIDKSTSVVIIGGGAVGIELAGEILDRYPKKSITIIQSGDKLLSNATDVGDKIKDSAKKALEDKGVKIVLNDHVSNMKELTFNTLQKQVVNTTGGKFETDLIFKAIGLKPNTQLLRTILGDDKMDKDSRVKVTQEMLVDGLENVYAIGDCCNTAQEKMAAHAQNHGETVAENIVLELKGKDKKAYKPRFQGMVIPIGSKGGVGDYNGWCLPSFAVKKFKSETLFVDMFWGVVDLKPPKVELNN